MPCEDLVPDHTVSPEDSFGDLTSQPAHAAPAAAGQTIGTVATRIAICHGRRGRLRPSVHTTPWRLDQRESARTGICIACDAGSGGEPRPEQSGLLEN